MELFNRVLAPPLQRRRDAWLNGLAERVAELEQEGRLKAENLQSNEAFVSSVMQASQAAIRNHQKEKIDALRNVVLNTALGALGEPRQDSKREMFLGFVDLFSAIHLRILKALSESDINGRSASGIKTDIPGIAERAVQLLPDLRDARALAQVAVEDLCRRGLLFWDQIYIPSGATQVSELGREFLRFISDPQRDE